MTTPMDIIVTFLLLYICVILSLIYYETSKDK